MQEMIRLLLRFTVLLCLICSFLQAQVGIGIINPHPKAILHLESPNRGFLPPRMTTVQRDAITTPPAGLTIYNTTLNQLQYFNGTCWISTFQANCTDCFISMNLSNPADTIDRVFTDSVTTTVNITQYAGTPQNIGVYVLSQLPVGVTYSFSQNPINSSGSTNLTFYATPLTPPGTYPIAIQAICGPSIQNVIFSLTILPCYIVNVNNSVTNYDMVVANPSLPTNQPICVLATVGLGVSVTSTNTNTPAFTTGGLHPQSNVAIVNKGLIIGRGGNGGVGGNFSTFGNPGGNGGNALNLTTKTTLYNDGYIFGGGGGGGSVGVGISFNVPVIGNVNFSIGVGGGGGAGLGQGGTSNIGPPLFVAGQNGTGGITGLPGQGGTLVVPFNIPIGPVNVSLNPTADGGDGGQYGYPGTSGTIFVCVNASVSVPIIGNITINVGCFPSPPPANFPPGGLAGMAIKRNGNPLYGGFPDQYYLNANLKGLVGP